jgi:hypothetical protein
MVQTANVIELKKFRNKKMRANKMKGDNKQIKKLVLKIKEELDNLAESNVRSFDVRSADKKIVFSFYTTEDGRYWFRDYENLEDSRDLDDLHKIITKKSKKTLLALWS